MDERSLESRVAELEERVRHLERKLVGAPPPPPPAPLFERVQAPPPATAPPAPRPAPAAPRAAPAPPRDVESFLGANWLAKAGVLVLALGVVFFLKLAFDQGWIGLQARYLMGLAGGLAMFGLGDWLRTRRLDPAYPQVVAGGGAVIAYATAYAGYAFDPLRDALGMTLPLTLLLLGLLSAALGLYAAWRDHPVLAGTAVALAIVLMGPAGDVTVAGVMYAAFLNAAFLAAAAWRGWGHVGALALVGADGVLFIGLVQDVQAGLVAGVAVALNALAVAAAEASRAGRREAETLNAALAPMLLFGLLGACLMRLDVDDPWGWSALGVGALAAVAGALLTRARAPVATVGALLLLAWPAFHFPGETTQPVAWLGLAAAGVGLAFAFPRARTYLLGAALAAGAAALVALAYLDMEESLVSEQGVAALLLHALTLLLGAGLWWLLRAPAVRPAELRFAALGLAIAAPVLYAGHLLDGWGISIAWAFLALSLVGLGLALDQRDLRLSAFAVFALVLGRVFLLDIAGLSTAYRVVTFLLVGALLLVAAFLYARGRPGGTFRIFK